MKTIYLDPQTMPMEVHRLLTRAFPDYKGRKFKMYGVDGPINMASYWDGGSREYFVVLHADSKLGIPQQSAFDPEVTGATSFSIPEGMAVVKRTVYRGKDMGLTLIVPADRLTQLAPPARELTSDQQRVLRITASLKSAYRREEAASQGISESRWTTVVEELAFLGLLRKNGSITPGGRNAC